MVEKEVQSSTLTIDGKDYLEADLSKDQVAILNMVKFIEPTIQKLSNKLAVAQDHKQRLINELKDSLEGVQDATIIETKEIKDESS